MTSTKRSAALLGKDAGGLSRPNHRAAQERLVEEHARWSKRDLSAKRYVYFWADGIHVQARLEDDAQCLLVIIGATPEGKKELVGLTDGVRESVQSWQELLLDLKRRGLSIWARARGRRRCAGLLESPGGGVAQDARPALLGAQDRQCPEQAAQEPASESQTRAAGDLDGRDQDEALVAFDAFIETYGVKYDKAVECLTKDRDALLAFYDFPAEHWKHLRTTNPIESTFATVRHRTVRAKGCLSNKTALGHGLQAGRERSRKSWRRLDGPNQLPKLIRGVKFTDGLEVAPHLIPSSACRLIHQAVTKIWRYLRRSPEDLFVLNLSDLIAPGPLGSSATSCRRASRDIQRSQ